MIEKKERLEPKLLEQILTKLGFSAPPSIDYSCLCHLYRAWCQNIPFDNIRKRIHLAAKDPSPLPGNDDVDFFTGWLRYGPGGLCWAGNAALHTLLEALGFSAHLCSATMLTTTDQPPNHGTVLVHLDNTIYLLDASMLHNTPLTLKPDQITTIDHPAWGLSCTPHKSLWNITWRPLHIRNGCDCRVEELSVSRNCFRRFNEATRTRSPFNDALYARINTATGVIGITGDDYVEFTDSGECSVHHISPTNRDKLLVEKMGVQEEVVKMIPPDRSFSK